MQQMQARGIAPNSASFGLSIEVIFLPFLS
jgi:hypothetical protein